MSENRNQEEMAKYAASMLASGDRCPFDAPDGWGDSETPPPPAHDWAERAARGIISELDDRGAAMNEAFHPEKIDQDTRKEIVEVMAAIMREARRFAFDEVRDKKTQELRKIIERMEQSRDEVSIAYNEGLFEGRLSELKDLGVLSADDVLAVSLKVSRPRNSDE